MAKRNRPAFETEEIGKQPSMSNPDDIVIEEIEYKVIEPVSEKLVIETKSEKETVIPSSEEKVELKKESVSVPHQDINHFNHPVGHIVRTPKIEVYDKKTDFSRVNYPVRETIQDDITKLSKVSRISANLIIEYILEDYLYEDNIQAIESRLLEYYKTVKFNPNGVVATKRKDLQLTLPTYYVEKVNETVGRLNDKHGLDLDKGNLLDILLEASIVNSLY